MPLDIEEIARIVDCGHVDLAGDRAKAIERLTAFAVEVVKRSTQSGAEPIGYIDPNQIKFLRNGHLRFVTMLRVPSFNQIAPLYIAPPAPVSTEPVKVNVHHVKLKSRKEMEQTIPRERLGWWHDVCPGENLVLRDATVSDLARCNLRHGADRRPENYLCELPESGSLVHRDAIKHCRTVAITAPQATDPKDSEPKLRGSGIRANHNHDAGAYARCSYCGRYSDNPDSLNKETLPCDCGKLYGWCGSFKKPTAESVWSNAVMPAKEAGK